MSENKEFYYYPYKRSKSIDRTVSVASRNYEESMEIRTVQDNLSYYDSKKSLAAFPARRVDDPAKSFYHLYTFNN